MSMPRLSTPVCLLLALLCWWLPPAGATPGTAPAPQWLTQDAHGQVRVRLYVFWSQRCSHCREALPFLDRLRAEEPWLEVLDFELSGDRNHVRHYVDLARGLGQEARAVPAFFVCGQLLTGFDTAAGMGARVLDLARTCRDAGPAGIPPAPGPARPLAGGSEPGAPPVEVPLFGHLETGSLSLPLLTLVLAGLDAFNPCAFFVLLFLLSLMVHARGRRRMLLVGGTFVLFSGLVYFLFMAAWLNLFLVVGGAPVVTTLAGAVALLIGGLNIKDWFWFRQGPSLSIPEGAKPGLFRRMRTLVGADRLGTMLAGTALLALAANSYELLCTAGFPMVYTRALTLHALSPAAHYGYLALYNLVYILPLLAIVLAFTLTLGARKLSEAQGRVLKLLSGLMMAGLGAVMLVAPTRLSEPLVAVLLLGVALVLAGLIARWPARPRPPDWGP